MVGVRSAVVVAALALLTSCSADTHRPSTAGVRPTAGPVTPDPRVGAVFVDGADLHSCTGSVLRSPAGDLI